MEIENVKTNELDELSIELKEPVKIDDGLHTGRITDVVLRITPKGYKYIDMSVMLDEGDNFVLKASYARSESTKSELGKCCARFGFNLGKVNLNEFKSLRVSFVTISEERDGNTYSNIAKNSLKPVEEDNSTSSKVLKWMNK